MSELASLDAALMALLAQCSPAASRAALREIIQTLKQRNHQRISAQTSPDGAAFAPRLPQLKARGALRARARGMMFKKLRGKLKAANTSTHATLEFAGASDKIAAVHHFGLADRVRAGIQVVYTARPLLGINPADEEAVREILLKHLSL